MLPPAPHVTVTNKGRRARDIRSSRTCKFEKPCKFVSHDNAKCKHVGAMNHFSLGGEEFEGEVIAILGHRCNFVRDLLHRTLEPAMVVIVWAVVADFSVMAWCLRR